MSVLRGLIMLAVLMVGAGEAGAQRDFSDVKIVPVPVRDHVFMLKGSGGNIGVSVGADGVLIVDDQFAPLADKIRAALKGLGGGNPAFVLNTHWHGDHTGGNAAFGTDGTIIAHTNVRKRLAQGRPGGQRPVAPAPKEALPVVTFDASLSVHFNGEEIRAVHVPKGHTDGDAVIFFTGANVVHMGDLFFAGRFPFVDLGSGGSVSGYLAGVEKVMAQIPADAKIIPGHGELSTLDDLKTYHSVLTETVSLVQKRMAEGQDLAAIQAAGLPAQWADWGTGFISTDRWIETIYNSSQKGNR